MALRRGRLNRTCLNNSIISSIHLPFLLKGRGDSSALENGTWGTYDGADDIGLSPCFRSFSVGLGVVKVSVVSEVFLGCSTTDFACSKKVSGRFELSAIYCPLGLLSG